MITVFTPTYNRKHTLPRLYESLLIQTNQDFEWLIVDDGSTDNTKEFFDKWIEEGRIRIIYQKKENGGKHRAINKGLELARGELFFIVDSDDYLPEKSLEIVIHYYNQVRNDDSFIGVVGLNSYPNGEVIGGKRFPLPTVDSTLIERREKYNVSADMAKVLITSRFKEFPFPDIDGERFVAESIVWNRMAIKYKFRYFNEIIYIAEYQEGGLSNNSIRNRRRNPKYATLLYKELVYNPNISLGLKMKSLINYWRFAFCKSLNIFKLLGEIKNIPLSLIALPIGLILNIKDSFVNEIKVKKIK